MKKVFLDIGNSRIKWAIVDNSDYQFCGGVLLTDFLADPEKHFFANLNSPIDQVYYACVSNAKNLDSIKNIIQSKWQLFPIELCSQQSCCGLESGYDDFHLLGSDRWMAMQGALSLVSANDTSPFIVIDFGTAVTVDAVRDGKHLGGFIVPGLTSLRSALAKDTADLNLFLEPNQSDDEFDAHSTLLATNTESAILGGTLYMSAAFINQIIMDLNAQLKTEFKVFLTGGDAKTFVNLIDANAILEEDLVLKGMVRIVNSVKSEKS